MLYIKGKIIEAINRFGKETAEVYHMGKLVWVNIINGTWVRSKPWTRSNPW